MSTTPNIYKCGCVYKVYQQRVNPLKKKYSNYT